MTIDLDVTAAEPGPSTRPSTRRQRFTILGLVAAVVVAGVIAVVVGGSPPPSIPPHDFDGRLQWVANLIDAPPRGEVAADRDYTRDLADRLTGLSRTSDSLAFGPRNGRPAEGYRVRVLFVDDIDNRRVALIALQNPEIREDRRQYALTELLWLVGARGAVPEALASAVTFAGPAADTEYREEAVAPVVSAWFGHPSNPVWVVLAPPQCEVATAASTDLTDWRPAATGSYVVRRPWEDGPEYWRVTCDGVVREERPAPRPQVSEHELSQVLAGAVGQPDPERLGYQLAVLNGAYGSELVGPPRVLWSGPVALSASALRPNQIFTLYPPAANSGESDDDQGDANVTIVAAPRARGGFLGSVWTSVRMVSEAYFPIEGPVFVTPTDPGAPETLFAIQLDRWRGQVLVLAPELAATVRILSPQGVVLDEAAVTDLPVMLAPGENGAYEGMRVEALSATGTTIATADLATIDVRPEIISAWD